MVNNLIACGGTFDHFHKGHEAFLEFALSLSGKLILGLTSDDYIKISSLKSQVSNLIESYEIRKKNLEDFLIQKKVRDRVSVLKINDLFGPTLSEKLIIDGIVISEDTKNGALIINQKRKELNLSPLKIFMSPSVNGENGKFISSAGIRNGEINREGKLYIKPAWLKKDLTLSGILRKELKKPFGVLSVDVLERQNQFNLIISVGDVITKKLNKLSVNQKISVIDFKVARKKTFSSFSDLGFFGDETVISAKNPAGHIVHDLFSKSLDIFKSNFEKRIILKITGEEDLAVLPLTLAAPLGTVIYYGQPPLRPALRDFEGQAKQGIMRVEVSEEIKKIAFGLVNRFKTLK